MLATKGESLRNDGKVVISKVLVVCCCVDSKAKLVHGKKDVIKQIVGRFLLHRSTPYFISKHRVSDRVCCVCSQMTEYSKVQNWTSETSYTGRAPGFCAAGIQPPNEFLSHKRMIHQGLVFTSCNYNRAKRHNNWCVRLADGSRGELHQILSYDVDGESELALLFIPFYTLPAAFPQEMSRDVCFTLPVSDKVIDHKCS